MSSAGAAFSSIATTVEMMERNFRAAALLLELSPDIQTVLSTPFREVHMQLPVRMDDAHVTVFNAFHVQHNTVRGASLGALRFAAACDIEMQRALAQATTWRCALVDVPFGGASSAIECDLAKLSSHEVEMLTRQFTARMRNLLGVFENVIAPDEDTSTQAMDWVFDECGIGRDFARDAVCGRSSETGVIDWAEASALGTAACTREVASHTGLEMAGARVIVIGFSKAARQTAQHLEKLGCRVVGISDDGWALYCKSGIDLDAVLANKGQASALSELALAQPIARDDLIATDCDILVCGSANSALDGSNARFVRARMIVEAANVTTTAAADTIFEEHGITVVPDLLATAGVDIGSYCEWEQRVEKRCVSRERIIAQIEGKMVNATRAVIKRAREQHLSLRTAAYCIAVERVARMERLRRM